MSRRRSRGRAVPPAENTIDLAVPEVHPTTPRGPQPPPEAVLPGASGPRIVVNVAKLEITDLLIITRFQQLDTAPPAEQAQIVADALPMLDRVVVGGLAGRPMSQLGDVLRAVLGAMNGRGNRGNSGRG